MPAKNKPSSAGKKGQDTSLSRQYLIVYNGLSFLLWASLLGLVVYNALTVGTEVVYPQTAEYVKVVQTLALLEVFHSLLGVVRAPVMTTAMQVASRLLLVWGIVAMFGKPLLAGKHESSLEQLDPRAGVASGDELHRNQLAYLFMLVAWSVTECVRYLYFVFFLSGGGNAKQVPSWLSWLRYNTFFILYPLGISCECWLVYNSLRFAHSWDPRYDYTLRAILFIYVPGSYILFTHMMAQRKRIMSGK